MGAKTWMLVYADGNPREALRMNPALDRDATERLASTLFPREKLEHIGAGDLSFTCPPDSEIHIGQFTGLSIVAAKEFAIDYPSKLPQRFLTDSPSRNVYLHAMHSVVDWFGYALWVEGKLVRSLSLSPDDGVLENFGPPLSFEEPYWSGEHPAVDPEEDDTYPLPFHPLELGEAALLELLGYQLEGSSGRPLIEPEAIPLLRFKRSRSRWKLR